MFRKDVFEMKKNSDLCYFTRLTYYVCCIIINQAHVRTNELHPAGQVQGISDKFPKSNIDPI